MKTKSLLIFRKMRRPATCWEATVSMSMRFLIPRKLAARRKEPIMETKDRKPRTLAARTQRRKEPIMKTKDRKSRTLAARTARRKELIMETKDRKTRTLAVNREETTREIRSHTMARMMVTRMMAMVTILIL